MWDIVVTWRGHIFRGFATKMMSIEHRNVPQNTPVASKRSLLEIVRLRLVARVT